MPSAFRTHVGVVAGAMVSLIGVTWVTRVARADDVSGVDLRSFRPSTDKAGTLATEGLLAPGPGNLQANLYTTFATTSLKNTEADGTTTRVVGPQFLLDPTIAIGIGSRLALGITAPMILAQGGNATSLTDGRSVSMQAIGDITLTAKAVAIAPAKDALSGGFGVAALFRLSLPTGDRHSFVADDGWTSELRGLLTYDYVHTLAVTVVAGYRMRQHQHDVRDVTIGDSIPWGITLGIRPRAIGDIDPNGHWTWQLEAHGEIGAVPNKLFSDKRVSPALFGPSIRYAFNQDLSLFMGAETALVDAIGLPKLRVVLGLTYAPVIIDDDEDGVPDSIDECPGLPGDKGGPQPGCPGGGDEPAKKPDSGELGPPADADSDNVADADDKCPNEPETFDGIDDADGCPEPASKLPPDRDRDGILDDVDKCPDAPETVNGYEDDDGCPEVDSDADTFLDDVDHCPNEPENFNGVDDEDGCVDQPKDGKPLAKGVALVDDKLPPTAGEPGVALLRKLTFDVATPAKEAASDLRALAGFILAHPGIRLDVSVRPESKTEEANKLAMQRAEALAQAIVRYAHTGGSAVAVTWDPKLPAKGSNVHVVSRREVGLTDDPVETPGAAKK